MPTIQPLDPTIQALKTKLASELLTSPAQPFGLPPPAEVTPPIVTSVAIGFPSVIGGDAFQHVLVFVEDVADCQLQAIRDQVEHIANQLPFAVLRAGRFQGQAAPSMAGSSISVYAPRHNNVPQVTAGTLGAVVDDTAGNHYILGSNHVMAYNGRAPHNTPIVTPGSLDDSVSFDIIGRRSRFVELNPAAWPVTQRQNPSNMNQVDCALATLTHDAMTKLLPLPPGLASSPPINTEVHKTGRTTGLTHGELCILDWEGFIDLSFGTFYFQNLMGVLGRERAFAAPGDSGAVVLDDVTNQPIGMVMARVYSAGTFLPGAPPAGPFTGYIVLMCSMVEVCQQLQVQHVFMV